MERDAIKSRTIEQIPYLRILSMQQQQQQWEKFL